MNLILLKNILLKKKLTWIIRINVNFCHKISKVVAFIIIEFCNKIAILFELNSQIWKKQNKTATDVFFVKRQLLLTFYQTVTSVT